MKPSVLFWIVGVLGFLLNLGGFAQMVLYFTANEVFREGFTAEQLAHVDALPAWRSGIWVLGVSSAVIASVLMLLKRSASAPLMFFGLVMLLIGMFHDASLGWFEITGGAGVIMYLFVASQVTFLWLYARRQNKIGVLR
ncbi:MAG: hypothetical protein AAFR65_02060 [Pseudomonadota bacterium]